MGKKTLMIALELGELHKCNILRGGGDMARPKNTYTDAAK